MKTYNANAGLFAVLLTCMSMGFVANAAAESGDSDEIKFIPTRAGRKLGAGILLGSPNGLTMKGYFKPGGSTAVEGVLGWSLFEEQLQVRADFLKEFLGKIKDPLWKLGFGGGVVLFTGGSESLTSGNEMIFKVRRPTAFGVLGVAEVSFNPERWEIYVELTPILSVSPSTEMALGLGLGGRYYW